MTRARASIQACLAIVLVLAIGWFYFWTAIPEARPGLVAKNNSSYYNLLTRGFLKGHLSLDLAPDPFLATLKDPSDPKERGAHGLHDISYYHGRYYIYFGVTPVLLLFLPFRLLTGNYLDDSIAVPLFACGGLVMAVLLLRAVRARYFPSVSPLAAAGCVLALGLANLVPMLLRRTAVWEVPIACGYFCCMTALWPCSRPGIRPAGCAGWPWPAPRWVSPSGRAPPTCWAAARCSSPSFPSCRARDAAGRGPGAARPDPAPPSCPSPPSASWLALYNYLRFGNPLDFGWRHMLNTDHGTRRREAPQLALLGYNLRVYALAPAGWSPYFPYVALAHLPPAPADFMLVEDSDGVLPNIPCVLLGLATLGLGRSPRASGRGIGWRLFASRCCWSPRAPAC